MNETNMQVRCSTFADKPAWDDYVLRHPDGTAYQLFAWKEAVEAAYAFEGVYLLAEDDLGICGILPLIDFRVPLVGRTLISLPYCDAGGVLADNSAVERALMQFACAMAKDIHAGIKVRSVRPLDNCGENRTDKVGMILDLPGNSEDLLKGFKSKFRLKIKVPMREGMTATLGKMELLDDFYAVFAENMHDLGSPVHSRLWLKAIISAYEDRVRVAVVYTPDKVPVAAGIILLHPSKVSNPWASSLRRYNSMRPNTLLYWALLSFVADNGYRRFDFGRSTLDEGTYHFKSQWGAAPCPLYWYELVAPRSTRSTLSTGRSRQIDRPSSRRQLAASLWQKLPQTGTSWLGPKIRKYISL